MALAPLLASALRTYTLDAAHASRRDREEASLEVGAYRASEFAAPAP